MTSGRNTIKNKTQYDLRLIQEPEKSTKKTEAKSGFSFFHSCANTESGWTTAAGWFSNFPFHTPSILFAPFCLTRPRNFISGSGLCMWKFLGSSGCLIVVVAGWGQGNGSGFIFNSICANFVAWFWATRRRHSWKFSPQLSSATLVTCFLQFSTSMSRKSLGLLGS